MMLAPNTIERQMVEVFAEHGRAPTGQASQEAFRILCGAVCREANKRGSEASVSELRAAIDAAVGAKASGWPSAHDIVDALPGHAATRLDSLDDAPVAEDCSRGCRRGLLEWIEPPRGSRQPQADGPRVSTACVCASGRWVRARDYLRVSAMDPDECLRRGYVPADTFAPMPVLLPEDVRWIHERADSMRPGAGQSYDGLRKMGGGRVAEAYREWVERNVPRQWR